MSANPPTLHLAIEALGVRHGGGATVLTDLVAAAIADPRFSRISIFCSPRSSRTFTFPTSGKIAEIECPAADTNRLYRWWWLERALPSRLARIHADVLISMCGAGISGPATPHVTFIQQSLPFSPEASQRLSLAERLRVKLLYGAMRRSARSSARIVVQTRTMRDTVAAAFHLDPQQIDIAIPSVNLPPSAGPASPALRLMRAARPGFRVLYVGSESKYKNAGVLLSAVETLRHRLPDLMLFLTWPADRPAVSQPCVAGLGYLDRAALGQAFQLADILVMPSLQETVGLPMLEAMSAGTPVIAADRPYAREVCGDSALFFDPYDPVALARCMEQLLTDQDLRTGLIARAATLTASRAAAEPYRVMLDAAVAAART